MDVIRITRQEMERITAELRVKTALKARLPPATQFDFHPGQDVRVYREEEKRWLGTFKFSRIQGKQIWITDGEKTKQFSCVQVLPDPANVADRELARLLKGFRHFNSGGIPGICVTDVVHPASTLNNDPLFDFPKAKELCGLI